MAKYNFYDQFDDGIPTDGHWKDDGTLVVTPIEPYKPPVNGSIGAPRNPFEINPFEGEGINWGFYTAGHSNKSNVAKGKGFYPNGEAQIELLSQGRLKEFYESLYASLGSLNATDLRNFLQNVYTYNERGLIFNPKGYFDSETGTRDVGLSQYTLALDYGAAMHTEIKGIYNGESQNDFLISALMDIVALVYWIWGGGKTRRLPAAALRLHWNENSFKPIRDILKSNPGPGEYNINGRYQYNIFSDLRDLPQAFALGQIVGNVEGVLTIRQDNSYIFTGEAVIYSGLYDANKGAGDPFREAATDVLRAIGDVFGHDDYTIDTYGSVPLKFEGEL